MRSFIELNALIDMTIFVVLCSSTYISNVIVNSFVFLVFSSIVFQYLVRVFYRI